VGRVGDKQWHGNALRVAEGRGFPRCATALLLRLRFIGGCASFLPHNKEILVVTIPHIRQQRLAITEPTTHSPHEYNNPQIASRGLQLS
jgi:hypothetical protein